MSKQIFKVRVYGNGGEMTVRPIYYFPSELPGKKFVGDELRERIFSDVKNAGLPLPKDYSVHTITSREYRKEQPTVMDIIAKLAVQQMAALFEVQKLSKDWKSEY